MAGDSAALSTNSQAKKFLNVFAAAEDIEAEDRDADAPNVAEVLDVGIAHLQEKGTWKIWQWPAGGQIFCDVRSFR